MARNTTGLLRGGPGRPPGVANKTTAAIKAYAGQYTEEAIDGLVTLGRSARSEQARVAAWREVLDRGLGRPAQAVTIEDDSSVRRMPESVCFVLRIQEPSPDRPAHD